MAPQKAAMPIASWIAPATRVRRRARCVATSVRSSARRMSRSASTERRPFSMSVELNPVAATRPTSRIPWVMRVSKTLMRMTIGKAMSPPAPVCEIRYMK